MKASQLIHQAKLQNWSFLLAQTKIPERSLRKALVRSDQYLHPSVLLLETAPQRTGCSIRAPRDRPHPNAGHRFADSIRSRQPRSLAWHRIAQLAQLVQYTFPDHSVWQLFR